MEYSYLLHSMKRVQRCPLVISLGTDHKRKYPMMLVAIDRSNLIVTIIVLLMTVETLTTTRQKRNTLPCQMTVGRLQLCLLRFQSMFSHLATTLPPPLHLLFVLLHLLLLLLPLLMLMNSRSPAANIWLSIHLKTCSVMTGIILKCHLSKLISLLHHIESPLPLHHSRITFLLLLLHNLPDKLTHQLLLLLLLLLLTTKHSLPLVLLLLNTTIRNPPGQFLALCRLLQCHLTHFLTHHRLGVNLEILLGLIIPYLLIIIGTTTTMHLPQNIVNHCSSSSSNNNNNNNSNSNNNNNNNNNNSS